MALFNYECDEVKRKIDEVSPNYPQLTTFEKEWLYFHKHGYMPGVPVELEYETVSVNPTGSVSNAIPFAYKSAILKGNTDENLQSVKMPVLRTTGKNLFGICEFEKGIMGGFPSTNVTITNNSISFGEIGASVTVKLKGKPNTKYTISFTVNNTSTMQLREWNDRTQTTNVNGEVIWRYGSYDSNTNNGLYKLENIQIEEGSVATSYEPHKSNILTVNEDVELRGIGEVKDELNLLTGELTQRIGEIVLDGDEIFQSWITGTETADGMYGIYFRDESIDSGENGDGLIVCDKLPVSYRNNLTNTTKNSVIKGDCYIGITMNANSHNEVKEWLSQNPITVQYRLRTDSVKTVALTPLNKPYEGTNHYELTANIPCEAILEVPVVSTGKQTLEEIND